MHLRSQDDGTGLKEEGEIARDVEAPRDPPPPRHVQLGPTSPAAA